MKVLIAEDDSSSRKLLKQLIHTLPNYVIVAEAANGEELIHYTVAEKPDIALVDIGMPLLNGMEAIKACKELCPSLQVIFITGNDDYALEAFSIRAVDYILKPIERERLYTALERASKFLKQEAAKEIKKDLMIKQRQSIVFVPLDEILFIERIERKTVIHTINQKYEINEALTNLERLLDSRFMAAHRSFIINLELLTRIDTFGPAYKAYFKNYNETAKVSKHKLFELQQFKSL